MSKDIDPVVQEMVQEVAEQMLRDYEIEYDTSLMTWRDFQGQAAVLVSIVCTVLGASARNKRSRVIYPQDLGRYAGNAWRMKREHVDGSP